MQLVFNLTVRTLIWPYRAWLRIDRAVPHPTDTLTEQKLVVFGAVLFWLGSMPRSATQRTHTRWTSHGATHAHDAQARCILQCIAQLSVA